MKTLVILLFALTLAISYVGAEEQQCKNRNGVCIAKKSAQRSSCKNELPYKCGPASVCCQKKKPASNRQSVRRKCRNTPNKCSREGGKCVQTKANDCKTIPVDKLCKGKSCTCCLGDNPKCNSSPACKEKGGLCIMKKKKTQYCQGGTIDEQLCSGKKCVCCLLDKGPNCKCGQANDVRIVGGEEVSPRFKYPWMVVMIILTKEYVSLCGASIISDRYILTAAHCLCNQTSEMCFRKESVKVKVADHIRESSDDDLDGVTMVLYIEEIILNMQYFLTDVAKDGDIALLKLREPLDFTAHKEIKPVCLPTDKSKTYEGYDAIVAGWGNLGSDYDYDSPDELREVTVPILSPKCESNYIDSEITDNMLCAGFPEGGKDSCQGDSGGPLIVKEGNTYTQVGIVSWGIQCAVPNNPGVYTRVTQYLDWIAENTRDSNYCSG